MIKKCSKCGTWALRGEEFCFWHSDSERAKKIRNKKNDSCLTLNDFLEDLQWMRRRLKRDKNTTEVQRLKVLTKLDLRIMKLKKMIKKSEPKREKRLLTGTQLIQMEGEKIIRKTG